MSKVPRDVAAGFAESSQKYYLALEKAKRLLSAVECPNTGCVDGAIANWRNEGEIEYEQCQWCAERKEILDG